jgi:chromosome segregation ATPase
LSLKEDLKNAKLQFEKSTESNSKLSDSNSKLSDENAKLRKELENFKDQVSKLSDQNVELNTKLEQSLAREAVLREEQKKMQEEPNTFNVNVENEFMQMHHPVENEPQLDASLGGSQRNARLRNQNSSLK